MLIVRHPPEKIKKEYCCWNEMCSDLAPGAFLLSNYQNGIYSWEKFRDQYRYQMKTYPKPRERIKSLYLDYISYNNNNNVVTFICYCSDETRCQDNKKKNMNTI